MTLMLFALRLVSLVLLVFFVSGALGHMLLFYERAAADAVRGERRPLTIARLRYGLGAWARESGLHVVMIGFWITGVLPRPRLKMERGSRAIARSAPAVPCSSCPGMR